MKDHDLKKFSELVDEKMKEYISVVQANQPHEKSQLISELKHETKEIKEHLKRQDDEMRNFKNEVSPMLRAFNDSENYKLVWTKTGITIKKTAGWVIVVGGALTVIWGVLKFGVKTLIK